MAEPAGVSQGPSDEGNGVQRDAVCFTAGAKGIAFGAGTVHAYLAADRLAPLVAAGISGGALNAAAMQRCYQELEKLPSPGDDREIARWAWFRRYLDLLTKEPVNVVWDGLPDQSDFFADMPPVKDPTPPLFREREAQKEFAGLELQAREELYLLVKAGNWLARLPLNIGRVATLLVRRVRAKEKYSHQLWRNLAYGWEMLVVFLVAVVHTATCPQWFPAYKFSSAGSNRRDWRRFEWRRPLVGWTIWSFAAGITLLLLAVLIFALHRLYPFFAAWLLWLKHVGVWVWSRFTEPKVFVQDVWSRVYYFGAILQSALAAGYQFAARRFLHLLIAAGAVLGLWLVSRGLRSWLGASADRVYRWNVFKHRFSLMARRLRRQSSKAGKETSWVKRWVTKQFFRSLRLEKHLVHDFHLRIRLMRLFGTDGVSPSLAKKPVALVLVAAPLQELRRPAADGQLWASEGTALVDALCASVALPGLFSPLQVSGWARANWLSPAAGDGDDGTQALPDVLDLVDGAVIRKNPIPALFGYIHRHPEIGDQLLSKREAPSIHVVYTHPVAGSDHAARCVARDVVEVGLKGLRLQERRDTELEVAQTNFTAELEQEIRTHTAAKSPQVRNIFADEISPETDISFKNPLSPEPEEMLKLVAQGCRRTMERLYRREITRLAREASTKEGHQGRLGEECLPCTVLQAAVRPQATSGAFFGLPEVCSQCRRSLQVGSAHDKPPVREAGKLAKQFPALNGEEPRVILLASGGVFRGPFHAGMLACLLSTQIRPQMIVGASVGTLMGGALGALLTVPHYEQALTLLGNLINVFLHVDERIAFTKPFKSAVRELGIRGRAIRLSPADIRAMIHNGSRSDPSFAAVGAPAPLIDAISDLTMIPHQQTAEIAAKFVAGQVTGAVNALLHALKETTLDRLGIKPAVIGVSLLEPTARTLLGETVGINLKVQQPYRNIAFFGTTSDIGLERLVTLGRYEVKPPGSYDFVQAALASSAFPCVFSPRRESDVFPGAGDCDTQLSDGGMFDNLPFIPAIEVLADIQREHRQAAGLDSIDFLRRRHRSPDLFIVGSLDILAENDENGSGPFDNLIAIEKRAEVLQNNVKIRSFVECSNRIHAQLDLLLDPASNYQQPSNLAFADGIVDAATLAVYPSDSDHLNPTFAFCRSLGFQPWRVRKSIADGCFQTFAQLIEAATRADSKVLRTAMQGLVGTRVPHIGWKSSGRSCARGGCPFFEHSTHIEESQHAGRLIQGEAPAAFTCPFYAAWQLLSTRGEDHAADSALAALAIYQECLNDNQHRTSWKDAGKGVPAPGSIELRDDQRAAAAKAAGDAVG